MGNYLRTCRYENENYLFHCFEHCSYVVPPSMLTGGHPGGQISQVYAIIEDKDGNIKHVGPEEITFTDHMFRNYYFPEPKK